MVAPPHKTWRYPTERVGGGVPCPALREGPKNRSETLVWFDMIPSFCIVSERSEACPLAVTQPYLLITFHNLLS